MSKEAIRISRHDLYKRVWETPMSRLATEFGLSDNGLAKICKRHDIPKPTVGYWAKKSAGKRLPRKPILKSSSNELIEIKPSFVEEPDIIQNDEWCWLIENEKQSPPIFVRKHLRHPDPLISQASDLLEKGRTTRYGLLISSRGRNGGIRVSPKSLRRALRILNALFKGLRERGFEVQEGDDAFEVQILTERLKFRIKENITVTKIKLPDNDLHGFYPSGFHRTEYTPSGRLCLLIEEWRYSGSRNFQKNWCDSERRQLEDLLNDFIIGLIRGAMKLEDFRRIQEEKERMDREDAIRREKEKQYLAERKQQIEEEKQRVIELVQDSENLEIAARIRLFIAAVQVEHENGNPVYVIPENLEKWTRWVGDQADRLDPLKKSPPSIIDQEPESPKEIDSKPRWMKN
jgi:hypothetical protein